MKSLTQGLLAALLIAAIAGCQGKKENALATDGATADDIAQYEADLAAANSNADYEDEGDE
ncbi:MAG: hypothetical protein AAFV88_06775 [Planctomycetota bacterium]